MAQAEFHVTLPWRCRVRCWLSMIASCVLTPIGFAMIWAGRYLVQAPFSLIPGPEVTVVKLDVITECEPRP
jgi:hypothetical protein